jgi:hypothetical protein
MTCLHYKLICNFARVLVMLILVGCVQGCNQTLTFQAVDANTLEPISCAKIQVDKERLNMVLPYRHEHQDIGLTSGDGKVSVNDIPISGGWTTHILFEHQGYFDAGCAYTTGNRIVYETKVNIYQETSTEGAIGQGPIIVKMVPSPPGVHDLGLHRLGTHYQLWENLKAAN